MGHPKMMPVKDLTGKVFDRLTVKYRSGTKNRRPLWSCLCICGNSVDVGSQHLLRGNVKSCGCLKIETIHGYARRGNRLPEYKVWVSMRTRCNNPNDESYQNYGKRGIRVCERWNDFSLFLEDMGRRPTPRHTIDRIDSKGDYEPKNCKWSTYTEQANNTRRNIRVEIDGDIMNLKQAVDRYGGRYGKVLRRFHSGIPIKEALGIG